MKSFNGLFGGSSNNKVTNESRIDWNDLTELKQLHGVDAESFDIPVLIFKHSTRCGISRMALKNFENRFDLQSHEVKPYFLDLLAFRTISDEIARMFGVVHQSPQLILITRGKPILVASHGDIDADDLKQKIRS